MTKRIVNLIGGRGYTGSELLTLIARHPGLDLGIASSRTHAGQTLASTCDGWPQDLRTFSSVEPDAVAEFPADAWVLALPNGLAVRWVEAIRSHFPDTVILDLSADYRFDSSWIYGLPERFRAELGHGTVERPVEVRSVGHVRGGEHPHAERAWS